MLPSYVKKPFSVAQRRIVWDFITDVLLSVIVFGPMSYVIGLFIYYLIH